MQVNELSNWVEQYTEELYRWAFFKTSSEHLAEDLVQDTFLAAAEKIENFRGDSAPKTWLFSILNYKIIDVYRKKTKQPITTNNDLFSSFFDEDGGWQKNKMPADWHEGEQHLLDNDEFQIVLESCLNALPEKWNLCVKLKYLSEKSGEEICQELDIAPTNYWQIIHRAKLQLRQCVNTNWFKS